MAGSPVVRGINGMLNGRSHGSHQSPAWLRCISSRRTSPAIRARSSSCSVPERVEASQADVTAQPAIPTSCKASASIACSCTRSPWTSRCIQSALLQRLISLQPLTRCSMPLCGNASPVTALLHPDNRLSVLIRPLPIVLLTASCLAAAPSWPRVPPAVRGRCCSCALACCRLCCCCCCCVLRLSPSTQSRMAASRPAT